MATSSSARAARAAGLGLALGLMLAVVGAALGVIVPVVASAFVEFFGSGRVALGLFPYGMVLGGGAWGGVIGLGVGLWAGATEADHPPKRIVAIALGPLLLIPVAGVLILLTLIE